MKKILLLPVITVVFLCCTNAKKEVTDIKDTKIALRADTVNVVKLSDTLVINESTCRGCAYENSTAFAIKDSLNVIKLLTVERSDTNPPDMAGGNISKRLILIPVKAGTTNLKMYKFWKGIPATVTDSIPFTPYTIEVRN
ncbi:MAG: hypothetical protein IPO53_00815 [Chitinophagaceae bacterium]|nr:hypothetical protein [Chitinophagaceae bacterium]